MSSKKGVAGVDNTFRKTWDKGEYADKANEREKREKEDPNMDPRKRKRLERDPLHQGIIIQRANLKARDFQIDLASKLNKTQVTSLTAPLSQQAGYYCDVCDCVLKDSHAYLDHLNGKWHNRALGMSMSVERSTADQVRKRLEEAKKRKKGGGGDDSAQRSRFGDDNDDEKEIERHVPDGMTKRDIGLHDSNNNKNRKTTNNDDDEEDDDNDDDNGDDTLQQGGIIIEEEDAVVNNGKSDDADDELDPEFVAMMGFGGFGGSKKS